VHYGFKATASHVACIHHTYTMRFSEITPPAHTLPTAAAAALLRRVWRSSLGNLVTGHDARKPFVDAFADEQLLGFTKVRLRVCSWVVGSEGTDDDPCMLRQLGCRVKKGTADDICMCVQTRSLCQHISSSNAHSVHHRFCGLSCCNAACSCCLAVLHHHPGAR
jgi:hypothetical protein